MAISRINRVMTQVVNNLPKLKKSFDSLTREDVYVGVPNSNPPRKPEPGEPRSPMNNATLLYIHDNGSPAANIPARPSMIPGVQAVRGRIINEFKKGAESALKGNGNAADNALDRAGLIASDSIRNTINEGIPPPLAESTLRARAAKGSKGARMELANRAEGLEASMLDAKPLVYSGQMRNAVTYVKRPK